MSESWKKREEVVQIHNIVCQKKYNAYRLNSDQVVVLI
jgi:hypothetical protein